MQYVNDLFDIRVEIGNKIKEMMDQLAMTKAELCRVTGISRPTLDKMLLGNITNKTNYDKHLTKIMQYLGLTSDMLLGNMKKNRTRDFREYLKKSIDEISDLTGISVEHLQKIEDGEGASLSEWRDIAFSLSTSVNVIKGRNYFLPQLSDLDLLISCWGTKASDEISGFWGHIGILPAKGEKYYWFPITENTRKSIYQDMNNRYMVITCMNNKVLFLNMDNINKVVLLDEACDAPGNMDWDYDVSEGEIPAVVYEALGEYCMGEMDDISDRLQKILGNIIDKYKLTDDKIESILNGIKIYYQDGKIEDDRISFDENENISDIISYIYDHFDYEDYECIDETLYYIGEYECECIIKIGNIAMIEFPLINLENAIIEKNNL